MNRRCDKGYYFDIGVLRDTGSATGQLEADVCHEEWLDYWGSCVKPDKWNYGLWLLIGAAIKAVAPCNCEQLCEGKTYGVAGVIGQCDCRPCDTLLLCEDDPECMGHMAEYAAILEDPKISDVLQLSAVEYEILLDCIDQLEGGDTGHWDQFSAPTFAALELEQLTLVWLRWVAVSLWHEVHCSFPWSILQYDADELRALLTFSDEKEGAFMLAPGYPGIDYRKITGSGEAWMRSESTFPA